MPRRLHRRRDRLIVEDWDLAQRYDHPAASGAGGDEADSQLLVPASRTLDEQIPEPGTGIHIGANDEGPPHAERQRQSSQDARWPRQALGAPCLDTLFPRARHRAALSLRGSRFSLKAVVCQASGPTAEMGRESPLVPASPAAGRPRAETGYEVTFAHAVDRTFRRRLLAATGHREAMARALSSSVAPNKSCCCVPFV